MVQHFVVSTTSDVKELELPARLAPGRRPFLCFFTTFTTFRERGGAEMKLNLPAFMGKGRYAPSTPARASSPALRRLRERTRQLALDVPRRRRCAYAGRAYHRCTHWKVHVPL